MLVYPLWLSVTALGTPEGSQQAPERAGSGHRCHVIFCILIRNKQQQSLLQSLPKAASLPFVDLRSRISSTRVDDQGTIQDILRA